MDNEETTHVAKLVMDLRSENERLIKQNDELMKKIAELEVAIELDANKSFISGEI